MITRTGLSQLLWVWSARIVGSRVSSWVSCVRWLAWPSLSPLPSRSWCPSNHRAYAAPLLPCARFLPSSHELLRTSFGGLTGRRLYDCPVIWSWACKWFAGCYLVTLWLHPSALYAFLPRQPYLYAQIPRASSRGRSMITRIRGFSLLSIGWVRTSHCHFGLEEPHASQHMPGHGAPQS